MALTFPVDKSDFTAPNGVTYTWDGTYGVVARQSLPQLDDFIVQLQPKLPLQTNQK